jgi:anti-sigma factor RsiW
VNRTFLPNRHLTEDIIDAMALGTLKEPLLAEAEEHLLVCPSCQAKFESTVRFIADIKTALTAYSQVPSKRAKPDLRVPDAVSNCRLYFEAAAAVTAARTATCNSYDRCRETAMSEMPTSRCSKCPSCASRQESC